MFIDEKKKIGIKYKIFKRPLEKGENQEFGFEKYDKLFLNYKKFIFFFGKYKKKYYQKN